MSCASDSYHIFHPSRFERETPDMTIRLPTSRQVNKSPNVRHINEKLEENVQKIETVTLWRRISNHNRARRRKLTSRHRANSCTGDKFDNFHCLFSKCGNVNTRFLPSGTWSIFVWLPSKIYLWHSFQFLSLTMTERISFVVMDWL